MRNWQYSEDGTANACRDCALWQSLDMVMGICRRRRRFPNYIGGKGANATYRKTLALMETHANDGCENDFLDKATRPAPARPMIRSARI
jgi:hypothetical protein